MTLQPLFDALRCELHALLRVWPDGHSDLDHAIGDVNHHVCAALVVLDRRTPPFARMDGASRVLAREAFLAVLALGQMLRGAARELEPPTTTAHAERAARALLDAFDPYISRADHALYRVLLDDMSLADAVEGMRRSG